MNFHINVVSSHFRFLAGAWNNLHDRIVIFPRVDRAVSNAPIAALVASLDNDNASTNLESHIWSQTGRTEKGQCVLLPQHSSSSAVISRAQRNQPRCLSMVHLYWLGIAVRHPGVTVVMSCVTLSRFDSISARRICLVLFRYKTCAITYTKCNLLAEFRET